MALSNIPLPWAHFAFFFLLFQVRTLIIITCPTPSPWTSIAPSLGLDQPISISHLEHRVSPNGFHQFTKTKLELSISPFLVIDDNPFIKIYLPLFGNWWQPFHKDMNCNLIESMLLAQAYLPCVKEYRQVSWTPISSNCSPYICAKSLSLVQTEFGSLGK